MISHLERFDSVLLDEGVKHSRYINLADPSRRSTVPRHTSNCHRLSTCFASHSCRVLSGYEYDEVVSMPRTMSAAEFKAKCLQAVEQVAATGEPIIVTKRGKPVAQLAPVAKKSKSLRGFLKGSVKSGKDIISPIGVTWDAARP